mmetsp:Transcript_137581/g.325854  ORF Transcript_137581/g.325854 Transcript_137581/m.325854 type:complete len:569 (+) Transcript_137581:21-1727(+)|eukprot:CAMPEP_0181400620 /NCGR_PEP_ID=MMETSP1110-20121109/2207_1 /TAXON_ID=174948 /ORGANISM="Symbiodinium sp., Strain CCMP421" /LENGTH=568 /DNA_ID=CAMNT_0023522721 /DNA_START=21 /DNA_END=1727 /DNA_ORIENTATION=+
MAPYDTLFAHEDQQRILQHSGSNLRRWVYKLRSSGVQGGLIWLLLLLFGFRQPREAVQRAITDAVTKGSSMIRNASAGTLDRLRQLKSRKGQQGDRGDFEMALEETMTALEPARHLAQAETEKAPSQPSQPSQPCLHPDENRRDRIFQFINKNMDMLLVGFLGYKLGLLVLYTMPMSYGFGIKALFLKWASRANLFRLYLRLSPLVCLGLVGMASAAVQHFNRTETLDATKILRWRVLAILNGILTYCTSRLFELIRGDPRPFIALEESAQDRDLLAFEAPAKGSALQRMLRALFWPQRKMSPPQLFGLEELGSDRKRLLFVGNHAILGIDVPLLIYCLYTEADIWPRPLGEHAWFSVPIIGELMYSIGAVDGTRRNCDLLMDQGCCLLVYPGGAREAWKRTTDKPYDILWGESTLGFVRMAVRHGYTIVPIATVGTEDIVKPVYDVPLRDVLTAGGMLKPPESSSKAFEEGARFPVVMPKPGHAQKVYFRIMPVLRTEQFQGQEENGAVLRSLRDETKRRLQDGISWLLEFRESDPDRYVFRSNGASVSSPVAPNPLESVAGQQSKL